MRATLAIVILLGALAASARSQEVQVEVEPREVDEGRPITLRVAWIHSGIDPAGLLAFEARATRAPLAKAVSASLPGASHREALWLSGLGDEALTLEVEAHEDIGAQARAPRPPITAGLAGEPSVVLRQVVAGESVGLTLEVVPLGATIDVEVVVRRVSLRPDAMPAGTRLYVQGPTHLWRPGEAETDPTGPDIGQPAPGGLGPAFEPEGAGGGSPVGLVVRLTRWIPAGLGPSPEVLVKGAVLDTLTPVEDRRVVRVKVRPAGFAAAVTRAGGGEVTDAVRLEDGRWVLGRAEQVAVVGGEPIELLEVPGRLFPWAVALARNGRAGLIWYEAHELPELAKALKDAGFVTGEGKGLILEVTTGSLSTFLTTLAKHQAALRDGRIERR